MNLLKIIVACFAIHYIRRLYQMYNAVKTAQAQQAELLRTELETKKNSNNDNVVEADFKIIDR
jgi:hypothetical protein